MAEDDILLEKIMTIPLRKVMTRPATERSGYAIKFIRSFVARHMHTTVDNVWMHNELNEAVWSRGLKKPPKSIKVRVVKWEDQHVEVELPEE
jgi:large subunit ribosomal protein L31e